MSISYENARDVENAVTKRLRRMPSPEEWKAAEAADVWNPVLTAWDERDFGDLMRHFRAHTPQVETGDQTGDWIEHSASVMATFKEEQAHALALFGLDSPLELAQVAPFLTRRAETEPFKGDVLLMALPSVRRTGESMIRFSRGYFEDERKRRAGTRRMAKTAEQWAQRLDRADAWAAARANPLFRFSEIVHDIVEATEMPSIAAVAFLLADDPIWLPRLTYRVEDRGDSKNPGITITLGIYDLSVEPREVERAYRHARSAALNDHSVFPAPDRAPRQRIRMMSARTRQMLGFCGARTGTMRFPQIRREWNAAHPEWEYGSPKSLYNAYKAAEARWGAGRTS